MGRRRIRVADVAQRKALDEGAMVFHEHVLEIRGVAH
jgi:hypothetical protein